MASFPWFNNPWEGVRASVPADLPEFVDVASVPAVPCRDLEDLFDDEDPLEMAAALAVDELIIAASTAAAAAAGAAAAAAVMADDNDVVSRLAAMGICGDAAISLIASSADRLDDVANEVLGDGHTAAAVRALHRVWRASVNPGQRALTDLSRRLLPPSLLPPGTRAPHRPIGTQSMGDLRGDDGIQSMGGVHGNDAPPSAKSTAALTASTLVFLAATSAPKRQRVVLPLAPEKQSGPKSSQPQMG